MKRNILNLLVALIAVLWLAGVHAAEDDMKQPLYLEADQVVIDEPKGVSRYTGHVRLTQGGMSLSADKIEVYLEGKQLQKVVAEGKPVEFTSKASDKQPETRAQAEYMEYRIQQGYLLMRDKAKLWQGGNLFSGGLIEFDTRHDRVMASRGVPGEAPVRVVIVPEAAKEAPAETPAATDENPQ